MITFINIPLGIKDNYTEIEQEYYTLYRERYSTLLEVDNNKKTDLIETYAQSEIPYWCLCLSSHLKANGLTSKILDYQNDKFNYDLVLRIFTSLGTSKLIAISCNTNNYHIALKIMNDLRQLNQNLIFVIGGPHATFTVSRCLCDGFDFVVKANGENAILSICRNENYTNSLQDLKQALLNTNNIAFVFQGKVIDNDNETCTRYAFTKLWEELDFSLYEDNPKVIRLFTSLGCNSKCAFCADTIWNRRHVVFFPVDLLRKHIKYLLKRFKPRYLLIGDENFLQNEDHFMKVSTLLEQYNVPYLCQARVDSVTTKKVTQLKKTGCKLLQLGVESSSDDILRISSKGLQFSLVKEKLELIKQFDLPVLTYWLVGLPGETDITLRKTVDWIVYFLENGLSYLVDYYIFEPYPGTQIYESPDEYRIKIQKEVDYSKWREDDVTIYELPAFTAQQLYDGWIYGLRKITQSLKKDVKE